MIQLTATNDRTTAVYRFIGKLIYLKSTDQSQAATLISRLRAMGANIRESRNWVEIDMIKDKEVIKLGPNEIDISEMDDKQIEAEMANFFEQILLQAGMTVNKLKEVSDA